MRDIRNDLYINGSGCKDQTAYQAIINVDRCFANLKGRCMILKIEKCLEDGCAFYKTKHQLDKEQIKASSCGRFFR